MSANAIPNWWAEMYATPQALGINTEYNGHYYQVGDLSDAAGWSWTYANSQAQALGGQLAIITGQGENDLIANYLLQGRWGAWIGLTDANAEGDFVWVNGTPLASSGYTNWSQGRTVEPNDGFWGGAQHASEDYVLLVGEGKQNSNLVVGFWNDAVNANTN